jgi:hypothetical protein
MCIEKKIKIKVDHWQAKKEGKKRRATTMGFWEKSKTLETHSFVLFILDIL